MSWPELDRAGLPAGLPALDLLSPPVPGIRPRGWRTRAFLVTASTSGCR